MMLKSLLGIASLFLALNFDAVVNAEINGAIPSIGGRYFDRRVEIPVPAFAQDDPRWSDVRLGPSADTLGDDLQQIPLAKASHEERSTSKVELPAI